MLSGHEIARRVADGTLVIDPYDPARLNPNSYNVRLGDVILEVLPNTTWKGAEGIDPALPQQTRRKVLKPCGFWALPRTLYLATTMERINGGDRHVPFIDGRSSVGRLGVTVHVTAGAGDTGFDGAFTLEIVNLHDIKVRLYPGMELGQVRFDAVEGRPEPRYEGGYAGSREPKPSKTWTELQDRPQS